MNPQVTSSRFAICLNNQNCEDLILCKIYQVIPDEMAEKNHYLRIVDESGEDYLYPANNFFVIELPQHVTQILLNQVQLTTA